MEPRELELPPGGEGALRVTALLDDAAPFRDTLHVIVADGEDTPVPLEAAGTGSCIVCEELAGGALAFGDQLTGRPWAREVTIRNLGRKGVALAWGNARADELAKAFAKASKGSGALRLRCAAACCVSAPGSMCHVPGILCRPPLAAVTACQFADARTHPRAGKKFELAAVDPADAPVFSVVPDRIVLGPREAVVATISGLAAKAGQVRRRGPARACRPRLTLDPLCSSVRVMGATGTKPRPCRACAGVGAADVHRAARDGRGQPRRRARV